MVVVMDWIVDDRAGVYGCLMFWHVDACVYVCSCDGGRL